MLARLIFYSREIQTCGLLKVMTNLLQDGKKMCDQPQRNETIKRRYYVPRTEQLDDYSKTVIILSYRKFKTSSLMEYSHKCAMIGASAL